MRTIHIGRNGQNLGVFPEDQVMAMLQSGQLFPTDLAWAEGMSQWQPLSIVVPIHYPPMGMPQVPGIATPAGAYPYSPNYYSPSANYHGPINWRVALIFGILYSVIEVVLGLILLAWQDVLNGNFQSSPGAQQHAIIILLISLASIICLILMVIFGSIMHYKCWASLPPQYRKTTPGMAIGLIFVPVFDFFWFIVSYLWLAEGYDRWSQDTGNPAAGGKLSALGLATGLISVAGLITNGIVGAVDGPALIGTATTILTLFLRIAFYRAVLRRRQSLMGIAS